MRAIAAGVLIGVLVGGTLVTSESSAQPAPDVEQAKALYKSAEQAAQEGRYADAVRDYDKAYDLTHDPVLFYKIGSANERAGKCDVALIYYGRYLREAKGSDAFVEQTRERIRACGGDDRNMARPAGAGSGSASAGSGSAGSAASAPGNTTPAPGNTGTTPAANQGSATTPPPAETGSAAAPTADAGSGAGSAAAPTTPASQGLPGRSRAAWLMVAGSVAFATVAGVLAYSANSAEKDIEDLYVGLNDTAPTFTPSLQETYDGLVEEGERYDTLAWVSFGVAGACAITAGILFWRGHERLQISPTASATSAGVTLGGRF